MKGALSDRPLLKLATRAVLVGVAAAAAYLDRSLPGISLDEGLHALFVGYSFSMSYVGLGAFTSVEPTIGARPPK